MVIWTAERRNAHILCMKSFCDVVANIEPRAMTGKQKPQSLWSCRMRMNIQRKNSNNLYITQLNELNFLVFTLFPHHQAYIVVHRKIASSSCSYSQTLRAECMRWVTRTQMLKPIHVIIILFYEFGFCFVQNCRKLQKIIAMWWAKLSKVSDLLKSKCGNEEGILSGKYEIIIIFYFHFNHWPRFCDIIF